MKTLVSFALLLILFISTSSSANVHPNTCFPFVYNASCSVECGQGTLMSITRWYYISNNEKCKPDETRYYPCIGDGCLPDQNCSIGVCTPHWHWYYPQKNISNTYKLDYLNNSSNFYSQNSMVLLYFNQTTYLKIVMILSNISVYWSSDGINWVNRTPLTDPSDLKKSPDPASFFTHPVGSFDEDTGILYFIVTYLTEDDRGNISLWTIYGPNNVVQKSFPNLKTTGNIVAFKGQLYYFNVQDSDLYYQRYNGIDWGISQNIANQIIVGYSVTKQNDYIGVMYTEFYYPPNPHVMPIISVIHRGLYPNGTFTSKSNITTVTGSIDMSLKQFNDVVFIAYPQQSDNVLNIVTLNSNNMSIINSKKVEIPSRLYIIRDSQIILGGNDTIMIALGVSHTNLLHSYDIFFIVSKDKGQNWSAFKQITNTEAKYAIKNVNDDDLSITSNGKGQWIAHWLQRTPKELYEASSFFYIDLKCSDGDNNCYIFDGEYYYPPRNLTVLPVSTNGSIWYNNYNLTVNNSRIIGNVVIAQSIIYLQNNSNLNIQGDILWNGEVFLNGTGQVVEIKDCAQFQNLSLLQPGKVEENQRLLKVILKNGCKSLPNLKINSEQCLFAVPYPKSNGTHSIIDYVVTNTCGSMVVAIVVPIVVILVAIAFTVAVFKIPALRKRIIPYKKDQASINLRENPARIRESGKDKYYYSQSDN